MFFFSSNGGAVDLTHRNLFLLQTAHRANQHFMAANIICEVEGRKNRINFHEIAEGRPMDQLKIFAAFMITTET